MLDALKAIVAIRDIALLLERTFGKDWLAVLLTGITSIKKLEAAKTQEEADAALADINNAFNVPS